jgi:hypothetical protein
MCIVSITSANSHHYKFSRNMEPPDDRIDQGHFEAVPYNPFCRRVVEIRKREIAKLVDGGLDYEAAKDKVNNIQIHIKVLIEEPFYPAQMRPGYDPKSYTGMVGLANLGATCYLNALLQVPTCLLPFSVFLHAVELPCAYFRVDIDHFLVLTPNLSFSYSPGLY